VRLLIPEYNYRPILRKAHFLAGMQVAAAEDLAKVEIQQAD
jgi:hypothetical protein